MSVDSTTFDRYGVVSTQTKVFVHYTCGEHVASPAEHDKVCPAAAHQENKESPE